MSAEKQEDPDIRWLREVYRPNDRQLTVRAVITGMLIGGVMSLSNLYIVLKTGWSFGVTITAGILAFVIFQLGKRMGLVKTEFGMLENNAMQSVASAAGYMTGGGTVAAIPGLMYLTHSTVPAHQIFVWITALAFFGVFVAIPMKRQMINHEQLRFPSGIAAAETLRSLHPEHAGEDGKPSEGEQQAKALLWAALGAAFFTWWSRAHAKWLKYPKPPETIGLPFSIHGIAAKKWTLEFDTSMLLVAAGAIMGWRAAWSMMLGTIVNYGFLAPFGHKIGQIPAADVKYKTIVNFTVWFGSSLLLTSGLLAFAFSWKQIAKSFASVKTLFSREEKNHDHDPLADIEVPISWFVGGVLFFAPIVIACGYLFFQIKWWMGIVLVVMSFFLAIVAARATGETDTTPSGALAKVAQLTSGALAPGSVTTNLMSANVAAGVGLHAADLLTDLKSGYLLGAKPRQQFLAQFFGVIAGSAFVVPAFRILVPDWTLVGSAKWPAPGAITWATVAKVLAQGVGQLTVPQRWLILIGAVVGIVMVLIERAFPKKKPYIPSAVGFGIAFTLPASNVISMFLGACIAFYLEKRNKPLADRYVVPVASGAIAGESLIGILIATLAAAKLLE
ncbi:MAG: OPT family oligopeptide transporter [Polyangiales bacterium]